MEVVASLSQGRTAAAQCGLFTYKSVPVIFEPPCISQTEKASFQLFSIPLICKFADSRDVKHQHSNKTKAYLLGL